MLFITHDLGVVAELCDEVVVMYAGRIAEQASVQDLFAAPRHPYTRGLIRSIPTPDIPAKTLLPVIDGVVPELSRMPPGCRFSTRCDLADELCRREVPELDSPGPHQRVACHHWQSLGV
jgi:peptide/nickel transport system ATP-binding protein